MCGIFGMLGDKDAAPTTLKALKRLEYRGYDSAGIAVVNDGVIERRRAVGRLEELEKLITTPLIGSSAIGHTRWATHGAATLENAHPHQSGSVAVVHNGIIENHAQLRDEMRRNGYACLSDTDTEVVAHLAAYYLESGMDEVSAAYMAVSRLEGAFALAFLFRNEPDLMIVTRRGSPLVIGLGEGEVFVGSDSVALAGLTTRVIYPEEGDFAVLGRNEITIADINGKQVTRDVVTISPEAADAEKGSYEHFMAKEMAEQPRAIKRVLDHYLSEDESELGQLDFSVVGRILLIGCGTAYHACLTARHWIEDLSGIPVDIDVASEYRYRQPPLGSDTLAIFVSQSGETADTLAALRYARGKAGCILSIVNASESTIARESDIALPLLVGKEIGVASTKAYVGQLTILAHIAMRAGEARNHKSTGVGPADLRQLPELMSKALQCEDQIKDVAIELASHDHALFLGRGAMHPLAMEGALKLKEISYIHAEGYPAGELKHGPLALVDASMPIVAFGSFDRLFSKMSSNISEVIARGGKVTLICDRPGIEAAGISGITDYIEMPTMDELLAPIVYAIPAQMLAYHAAVAKGRDVDKPRNLAKSVCVE